MALALQLWPPAALHPALRLKIAEALEEGLVAEALASMTVARGCGIQAAVVQGAADQAIVA